MTLARLLNIPGSHLRLRILALLALIWILVTSLLFATPASATGSVIELRDTQTFIQTWPSITELSDPEKKLSIAQVMQAKNDFKQPQKAFATLGMRKDAVWLHIPVAVTAASNGVWVLDIDYPVINRIDLYVTSEEQLIQQTTLGNLQPRAERAIDGRAHAFGLRLKPGSNYDLYLRVENTGAMILPISLNKPSMFHTRSLDEHMLQGLLTGLALCLLVYSLAQWVSLSEHLFVKYAILISGSILFSLLQFGIGAQYLWSDNIWIETHLGGISALIAIIGTFLFIEQVLAGPDLNKWLERLMQLGAGFCTLVAISFSLDWIDIHTVTLVVSTVGLLPTILGSPGAFARARRGDPVGIYFLLAWTAYFIATAIMIELIKGRLPANFWTMHSFQFGATFDMLIFMKVLGLRTKAMHTEMLHTAGERDKLHSLAHSDPLTGLPNRREIHTAIANALALSAPEKIVAVYMLDLDGFKLVNDQYGHDIGDELLISVARRLQANLRPNDIVARLGGDEFVVMAKDLNSPQEAQDLAEKLLSAFNYAFILTSQTCRVGLTIGYALAPFDGQLTPELLKRADAAMYCGKQDGKHCARRGEISENQGQLFKNSSLESHTDSAAA
ncbi:diguanylate cyclase [Undibacterium parvum]|uniref:GGDEF domain-containing protein n=1 Tax=Undibacterium parvum TaxID=401471 RepID=A0A3S9HGW9_9BURK|nr:diguanylate cyclase [Undibacterium parvum]AZP11357.1 GGDEF domain-containing protein [Undibacterium parvum]